jgi:rubrerythrin
MSYRLSIHRQGGGGRASFPGNPRMPIIPGQREPRTHASRRRCGRFGRKTMTTKPTYLGLLNAISNAETRAARYFYAWLERTTDPEVRAVVQVVAVREAEHGLAFEKRILELGYALMDRPDPKAEEKLAYLADPARSDLDRLLYLGYGQSRRDPFGQFFDDHTIDPQTGGLLGRYIAEERDSIRRLQALAETLKSRVPQQAA